ncbi:hypothetical protein ACFSHT_22530 [Paraburkholderia silviterrae]|uniref:Holin n=1 Tax=Paraburkholderia silviterrae TaxID=2528715 RepID=A0A4R5MF28_9BURK|nr:hypothetical protein [Paraburkholderia silviterrae]TDG25843.1 hypothetical protein EYW47_00280 [Paraburkholderia silviterrae]
MNGTPTHTAIAAGAAALIVPVVDQVATALHMALTSDVRNAIVVLVVAGTHWLSQKYAAGKQPAAQQ